MEKEIKEIIFQDINNSLKRAHKIINNGIKNPKLAKQVCYGATISINESIRTLNVTFEWLSKRLKDINNHCDNISLLLKDGKEKKK